MQALTLDASGLRLRNTRAEELNFVHEAEAAPENRAFVGQWSEGEHLACMSHGDCRHLVIEEPRNGALLGYVLLQGLSNPNRSMLLRRLVVARKGMGAGPRAVEAVMRFCFEKMRFHRLWLDVRQDNAPARRIYERFGFSTEGCERENVKLDGGYVSTLRMSILDREFDEITRTK